MLRLITSLWLAGVISLTCFGQGDSNSSEKNLPSSPRPESASKRFYHLSFVVQELDNDRVINSRSYSMVMRDLDDRSSSIRAGEKVPVATGGGYQQMDVGVNIDCGNLEVTGDRVALHVKAEISSMTEDHEIKTPPGSPPIVRNNQWESKVILPLKQPSVLFSSDDPASKRKMQLQLTVMPVK